MEFSRSHPHPPDQSVSGSESLVLQGDEFPLPAPPAASPIPIHPAHSLTHNGTKILHSSFR